MQDQFPIVAVYVPRFLLPKVIAVNTVVCIERLIIIESEGRMGIIRLVFHAQPVCQRPRQPKDRGTSPRIPSLCAVDKAPPSDQAFFYRTIRDLARTPPQAAESRYRCLQLGDGPTIDKIFAK